MDSLRRQPEHLRASDVDRDQVIAVLGDALAEGRLTAEEHSERMDQVYSAKTLGELTPIVEDLPEDGRTPSASMQAMYTSREAVELAQASKGRESIAAVFGGAGRSGRWLVEPHTNVTLFCGGADLDFREAVLSRREVTVQCAVVLGGLNITVPPGVKVVNHTSAILGGASLNGTDAVTDPRAPVIHITGTCVLGGVSVEAKREGEWSGHGC
jgi:hypothetical protein